jgi:hypothetical protein
MMDVAWVGFAVNAHLQRRTRGRTLTSALCGGKNKRPPSFSSPPFMKKTCLIALAALLALPCVAAEKKAQTSSEIRARISQMVR